MKNGLDQKADEIKGSPNRMKKILRISAVPRSIDFLLRGQMQFLSSHYEMVGVASPDEALHRKIAGREKIRMIPIRIERQISPLKDLVSLIQLCLLFIKERPDAVHSMTPKAGLLSMTAAFLTQVPVRIHTFTGLIFPWKKGRMYHLLKTMDRLTCAFATHIIPEGNGVKADLQKHRVTAKPLSVLAHGNISGVDVNHFTPVPRNKTDQTTRFVFIGRIVRDKGIEELKEAFERLTNAEIVFVGEFEPGLDPVSKSCEEWVKGGDGVRFVGFQDDVRPFIAEADVLVLPSHREGFPNTLLQAGAMGRPVIASDICGCNEIVIQNQTGLLHQPKDSESLYQAMNRLCQQSERLDEMGTNARKHIVEHFSQELVWQAQLEFYHTLLEPV